MASINIADLPNNTVPVDADELHCSQSGIDKILSLVNLATYIQAKLSAFQYKGGFAVATNTWPYPALPGWFYKSTTAGTFNGVVVEVGDALVCNATPSSASDYTKWDVFQGNIDTDNLKNSIDPLGIPKPFMGSAAPTNHVLAMSQTIGSAGSGATYAGSQYQALYTALWENAGTANTTGHWMTNGAAKGASAATDFGNNRTITMDYRGAVLRATGAGVGWTDTTDAGPAVNTKQNDAMQYHWHKVHSTTLGSGQPLGQIAGGATGSAVGTINTGDNLRASTFTPDADNGSVAVRSAKETRMKNIGVNIIFRYQ